EQRPGLAERSDALFVEHVLQARPEDDPLDLAEVQTPQLRRVRAFEAPLETARAELLARDFDEFSIDVDPGDARSLLDQRDRGRTLTAPDLDDCRSAERARAVEPGNDLRAV